MFPADSGPVRGGQGLRLAGLVGVALLGACGRADVTDLLADYRGQVEFLVGAAAAPSTSGTSDMRLPTRRERRIELPDHRTGGREFLAMQGCRLAELVGLRNSPMGRVMVPTRRLIYEVDLLEAADACFIELEPHRAQPLRKILDAKRRELPGHIWNAIWLGEEMEAYLGPAARPFANASAADVSPGLRAVLVVARRPVRRVRDATELEQALAELRGEPPAGRLLRRLDRVRHDLDAVAAMLEPRTPGACRDEALRLARLFETRYLPLQAELARLDRRARERIEALDGLFAASARDLGEVPAVMLEYRRRQLSPTEPDGAWQRYRRALRRHALAWQPTLVLCGVLPATEDA